MPAFEIVADAGDTADVFEGTVSSITASDGDLLELDLGATAWTVASAATEHWQKLAIAQGAIVSADTVATLIRVNSNHRIKATSNSNSNTSANGDRMILSSQSAVNNTGTDDASQEAIFVQEGTSGVAADKKILGYFVLGGAGVNPDAS